MRDDSPNAFSDLPEMQKNHARFQWVARLPKKQAT
jgi:hypothetical protein